MVIQKKVVPLQRKRRNGVAEATGTTSQNAKIAQLVEHDLAKVGVAGSSPVFRSTTLPGSRKADRSFTGPQASETPNVRMAELVDALL